MYHRCKRLRYPSREVKVEIELRKSFLPNFAGTVKYAAKYLVGWVPYVFLVLCRTGMFDR